ncbi:rCG28088, isoform CRA_a [Rattus norvegicus]|uniref:RCG28088, isoform CRA_a n=1 Tax=Rattus norvegicus TaxID=10116 RepID=A6IEV5_RAT|nr:rCG28088, isoform CRA_a [Rattus norvegicus]
MDASHKLHCEPGHSAPMPPAHGSLKGTPPLIRLPNFTSLP